MATTLTQADLDKLEKAYAQGALTVSYGNGNSVTFANSADMLKRIQYVKNAIAATAEKLPNSTYASYERC